MLRVQELVSIRRWIVVIFQGVAAAAITTMILHLCVGVLEPITAAIASAGLYAVAIATTAIISIAANRISTGRMRGAIGVAHFFQVPPAYVSLVIGLALQLSVFSIPKPLASLYLSDILLLLLIAVAGVLTGFLYSAISSLSSNKPSVYFVKKEAQTSAVPLRDLDEWISLGEKPISTPDHDLFGTRAIAIRMLGRLAAINSVGSPQTSIILRGPQGSGKTSLFRLMNEYVKVKSSGHGLLPSNLRVVVDLVS